MKSKTITWIVIALIVIIGLIVLIRENAKAQQIKRAQEAENNAVLAAIQLQMNRDQLEASESASIGDWLGTVGSVADAVSSIFTGVSLGLGGGEPSVG